MDLRTLEKWLDMHAGGAVVWHALCDVGGLGVGDTRRGRVELLVRVAVDGGRFKWGVRWRSRFLSLRLALLTGAKLRVLGKRQIQTFYTFTPTPGGGGGQSFNQRKRFRRDGGLF